MVLPTDFPEELKPLVMTFESASEAIVRYCAKTARKYEPVKRQPYITYASDAILATFSLTEE